MRPLEVTKYELEVSQKPPSTKQKSSKDLSIKRLRYYFKKKNTGNNMTAIPDMSLAFNDHVYFQNSASAHLKVHQTTPRTKNNRSNLLQRDKQSESKDQAKNCNPESNNPNNKDTNNYFASSFFCDRFGSLTHSKQKLKPRTARDLKRPSSSLTDSSLIKNNSNNINPYTKKQYLHFSRREREKHQKALDQIHKKQMFYHILKPCKIKQIEIKDRISSPRNMLVTPQTKKRPQTSRKAKQDNMLTLDPWDSSSPSIIYPYDHEHL